MELRTRIEMVPRVPLTLPLHYSDMVQGFIYRMLSDRALSTQLHDRGLRQVDGKPVKLFAYSRLMGTRYTIDHDTKTITFSGPIRLVVTSALDEMIYDLTMSLLKAKHVSLHDTEITVRKAQLESYNGTATQTQVRFLSPVTVYRTITQPDGKKFTQYYRPGTEEFDALLRQNLALKARALGDETDPRDVDLTLTPISTGTLQERILFFHGSPIHAWEGDCRLQGSMRYMALAWNAGLGGKGSAGCGVFDVFSQGR